MSTLRLLISDGFQIESVLTVRDLVMQNSALAQLQNLVAKYDGADVFGFRECINWSR